MNVMNARKKLNPGRLHDQMFAITVTNQIVGSFLDVGLPFVLKGVNPLFKKGGKNGTSTHSDAHKKKVVFEDEKEKGAMEEREYLERVRSEAALPEYPLPRLQRDGHPIWLHRSLGHDLASCWE
jgi:anoctamin-10